MKSSRALKKSEYAEEVDEGTWALSYGDMITLLLSFFVIFFTTDSKKEKVEKLNRHMSFIMEGPLSATAIDESIKRSNNKEPFPVLDLANVKVTEVDDQLVVSFGKISFFQSGSTELHEKGKMVLRAFAQKFQPYIGNYRVSVKGFTDRKKVIVSKKFIRKYVDNLELSALRSISAMRILQTAGVPLNRMEIAGIGEMNVINSILAETEKMDETEINALSRTIIIVIKPEKESWL